MSDSPTSPDPKTGGWAPAAQSLVLIGWAVMILALGVWGVAFIRDIGVTTLMADGSEVVNLSLLHIREVGFQIGSALLIAGAVLAGAGHVRKGLDDLANPQGPDRS